PTTSGNVSSGIHSPDSTAHGNRMACNTATAVLVLAHRPIARLNSANGRHPSSRIPATANNDPTAASRSLVNAAVTAIAASTVSAYGRAAASFAASVTLTGTGETRFARNQPISRSRATPTPGVISVTARTPNVPKFATINVASLTAPAG